MFIFILAGVGRAEREGERESQAVPMLSVKADKRVDLTTMRSRPELKSRVGHLTN